MLAPSQDPHSNDATKLTGQLASHFEFGTEPIQVLDQRAQTKFRSVRIGGSLPAKSEKETSHAGKLPLPADSERLAYPRVRERLPPKRDKAK